MKKIFVVALGVALCFALAASASAIDNRSLENRTSEGLYDRNDAFDLARQPSHLYQVKPLHLWTVGSGYSSPGSEMGDDYWDSDSFLVGIARELGPGSFAVFFETNKESWEYNSLYTEWANEEFTTQSPSPMATQYFSWWFGWGIQSNPDPASAEYPSFSVYTDADGNPVPDLSEVYNDWIHDKWERTEYNASVAYSLELTDTIAVGAAYEPQFIDEEETIYLEPEGINIDDWPEYLTTYYGWPLFNGGYGGWPFFGSAADTLLGNNSRWFFTPYSSGPISPSCWLGDAPPVGVGSSGGWNYSSVWYPDVMHSASLSLDEEERMDGKRESDTTVHPVEVEGHFTPSDTWDVVVGVGYADVEHDDTVSGIYNYNYVFSGDDPDGNYWEAYSGLTGYTGGLPQYDSASFVESWSSTFTVGGSLRDVAGYGGTGYPSHADSAFEDQRDGNEWSIYLSPTYFMNDMHAFRLDLGYANEDGDFTGGLLGQLDFSDHWTVDVNGEEETYWDLETTASGTQVFNSLSNGDYEVTSYFVEPRWYVNFDKVRFSAGLGWYYEQEEWDGVMNLNSTLDMSWANLSTGEYANENLMGNNDGRATMSYTGHQYFNGEITTTTWRAPVAVQFDITEKLTARAGAAYYRVTQEETRTDSEVLVDGFQGVIYDEDGVVAWEGPGEQYLSSSVSGEIPSYDRLDNGCSLREKVEDTWDYTTYHLGLGYYFTENLQFDLMYSGQSGYVDASTLYGSFTIIFP